MTDRDASDVRDPRTITAWKSRAIFVSSTFADMHAERDHLRKHAFSVLEEQLRERCHYLETIDLRLGVETATEHAEGRRELKVLKVCLDEIERSRPFFVGLLGDRYGWVPPAEQIEVAAREAGFDTAVAARSVTELEILYGVLENRHQRRRSWFYIRDLDYAGMPSKLRRRYDDRFATDPDAADRVRRLEALKDRLRRELPERVRSYPARWDPATGRVTGLHDLACMVREDLWSDLDDETREHLRQAPDTWQQADRRTLEDFVTDRTQLFVERPATTGPLIEHALSPIDENAPWGVLVTGESGSGKSSVFSWLYTAVREPAGVLLLANAAGMDPRSVSADRMLRRWVSELAGFLGVTDPLERMAMEREHQARPGGEPAVVTAGEIEEAFAALLGRAAQRVRVVVLIDALNQFEATRARYLTWLPEPWPANARLLVTTIPAASAALADRLGVVVMPLQPVRAGEALEIARRHFRDRYHREPNARALELLLSKGREDGQPAYGNPLWLELALQEMNLLEADDYARAEREFASLSGGARMEALLCSVVDALPHDATGVYGWLLDRAERDFGAAWTKALMHAIALGRAGWRESDLQALVPAMTGSAWDELAFAGVRRTLGTHLVQRGTHAQWDAFHASLRDAVIERDLHDEGRRRRLHGLIVDHLQALPEGDPLRVSETMAHLIGLRSARRLAAYLADLDRQRWAGLASSAELAAAAGRLAEWLESDAPGETSAARQEWTAALLAVQELDGHTRLALVNAFLFDLNAALSIAGSATATASRRMLLERVRTALEELLTDGTELDPADRWRTERAYTVTLNLLGALFAEQGRPVEAQREYAVALAMRERIAMEHPNNSALQRDIYESCVLIGTARQEAGNLTGALESQVAGLAVAKRLATADPENAQRSADVAVSLLNIGDLLRFSGRLAEALEAYEASLAIRQQLPQSDADNEQRRSECYLAIGSVRTAQGDLVGAIAAYEACLAIRQRLAAADPLKSQYQRHLAWSHASIGDAHAARGDFRRAAAAYETSLAIREHLVAADPFNATWQHELSLSHETIGDVRRAQGDLARALAAYEASHAIRDRQIAASSNTGWRRDLHSSLQRIGLVREALGDLTGAAEVYRAGHAIAQELVATDPSNTLWQSDLSTSHERIGDIESAKGDSAAALAAYQASHAIRLSLAAADSDNAEWQRSLAVSHGRIADARKAQGELAAAAEEYRASHAIWERLTRIDPLNAMWQEDLAISQERVGDIRRAQRDFSGALNTYRASHALRERLAASDPGNTTLQSDLASSHEQIGVLQQAGGSMAAALAAFHASREIREGLVACDADNVAWQRKLWAVYWGIANVLEQSDNDSAARWWRKAYRVIRRMERRGVQLSSQDRKYLDALRLKLHPAQHLIVRGTELMAAGRHMEAIEHFDRALQIDPLMSDAWHGKGTALAMAGRYEEAIPCFDRAIGPAQAARGIVAPD